MSALEPGAVMRATVRGKPDVLVLVISDGKGAWSSMYIDDHRHHPADMITDARPLIVLDLDHKEISGVIDALHDRAFYTITDQIEAQTKPARIPEPGLWGVVKASVKGGTYPRQALRVAMNEPQDWLLMTREHPDLGLVSWDDLIDPTLVRDGLES